jgi:hypothetical protein
VAGAKRAAVKRGRGAPAKEGRVGGGHGEGEGIVMRPGDRSHDRPGQGRAPRRVPKSESNTLAACTHVFPSQTVPSDLLPHPPPASPHPFAALSPTRLSVSLFRHSARDIASHDVASLFSLAARSRSPNSRIGSAGRREADRTIDRDSGGRL